MGPAVSPPAGWKIRQIPWLAPGTSVVFTGRDLTHDRNLRSALTVGATLGGGGQAAVFSVNVPQQLQGSWAREDVVLRVSYEDEEFGRDPRRTAIYRHLARLRGDDPATDPLEGLLRLHAVGHLPAPDYLPGQDLWAQLLDRGGIGLQQWIGGNHPEGLGAEGGVSVMMPVMHALALCHREGIVHRDIKPGNVFVNARSPVPAPAAMAGPRAAALFAAGLPFLRLGDLGSMTYLSADAMARLEAGSAPEAVVDDVSGAGQGQDAMTHAFTTNVQSGPFTPPEVWSSAAQTEAHPAGDVWQLAVTLFYACTGELPFQGWRSAQWRADRSRYVSATQDGEPNADSFPQLPERLQYLLRWCLTPDPLDRPDIASLTDDLAQLPGVVDGRSPATRAAAPAAVVRPAPTPPEQPRQTVPDEDHVTITASGDRSPGTRTRVPAAAQDPTEPAEPDQPTEPVPQVTAVPGPAPVQPRSHRSRRAALVAGAATVVVLLVLGLALLRNWSLSPRHTGGSSVSTPARPTALPALGDSGKLQWNLRGATLSQVLPQLFTDTPLAQRPNLGQLTEHSFQFCNHCAPTGVRLRVDVTPPGDVTLTANGRPAAEPIGPYLVVLVPRGRTLPIAALAADRYRTYRIPARYASTKFGQVVLVPMNRTGEGDGGSRWQTHFSGSGGLQHLTFDIPGGSVYITVLWFNTDGVVGFNQFQSGHKARDVDYP